MIFSLHQLVDLGNLYLSQYTIEGFRYAYTRRLGLTAESYSVSCHCMPDIMNIFGKHISSVLYISMSLGHLKKRNAASG